MTPTESLMVISADATPDQIRQWITNAPEMAAKANIDRKPPRIFRIVATRTSGGFSVRSGEDSAEQILKRRYAKGEIDREDCERRVSDIRR